MKILITGGAGFIGSAVIRLAINRGHRIVNLDALTYAASLENLSSISSHPNYIFLKMNIQDRESLDSVFSKHKPDAVMHLAAESHVDRSIDEPSDFVETNITGTFNILEAARKYWEKQGCPDTFRFHHVSTDEVFGSLPRDSDTRFTEKTPYDPRSPYSASKAGSDHLVRAWHSTYGLPVILTNCSNNFGPYQFPEKLIPLVIINALSEKSIPIYGTGNNIRDWLYVDDHANALLLAIKKGASGRTYNIGDENERTNLEVVKTVCSILDRINPRKKGHYADLITFVADRPGHDARYAINPSRIRKELGWQTTFSFDQNLEKTVQWYLNNQSWWQPLLSKAGFGERQGIKS